VDEKNKIMRRFWLLLLLVGWHAVLAAQVKYEREYRLPPGEVPAAALRFIDSCDFERRVRWYGEERTRGRSVEAKVKASGARYSIEFDTLGRIEDVEKEVDWPAVPRVTRDSICDYLARHFDRYRIQRVQQQWTADRTVTLLELVRTKTSEGSYLTRYELIVRGRTAQEGTQEYELLFSETGNLERRSRIVYRNTDNLDY
jgi:hypothetical protein